MTATRSRALKVVATLAGGMLAGCAATPDGPGQIDALTVSGRFGLPVADASGPRLRVDSVVIEPAVAQTVGLDASTLSTQLAQAATRSLANHGWSSPDGGTPFNITVQRAEVVETPEGSEVALTLEFSSDLACAATSVTPRFLALRRRDDNGGQRVAAVLATAAMAAGGVNGGQFLMEQLTMADADADADGRNLRFEEGRATPPRRQRPSAFAARQALGNGLVLYVAHLAATCNGKADA